MHLRSEHSRQLVWAAAAILTIALYVLSWKYVPLFYDEAAFRRHFGRAFIDGYVQYSFFPACTDPKAVPLVFAPAHAFLSWIDSAPYWGGVRAIPMIALGALVGASAMVIRQHSRAWGLGLAVLCGGFVGLSGVGLVLSRWEFIATLHIAMILVTWFVARCRTSPLWLVTIIVVLHLAVVLLSLFVHLQGLLLVPLSVLTLGYLLRGRIWLLLAVFLLTAGLSAQALAHAEFRCPQDPVLEDLVKKTHGVVLASQMVEYSWPERIVRRLVHYEQQFFFQHSEAFSIPVPQVPKPVALGLIPPVAAVVALNLIGTVFGAAGAAYLLWRDFAAALLTRRWSILLRIAHDGRALWLAGAILLLLYSFVDVGGIFYRAHYRNLLSAVLMAIATAYLLDRHDVPWLWRAAVAYLATAALSALAAWLFLAPQLARGYESYYVSLQRDWPAFNARVRSLAEQCDIRPEQGSVVVDVATYDALRDYPRPIDYNYVWYGEYLKGELKTDRTEEEWLAYFRQYGTSGYVAMCRTLDSARLPVQHRDGGLCCMNFGAQN